jgi:parallel beta-helix repeat protein
MSRFRRNATLRWGALVGCVALFVGLTTAPGGSASASSNTTPSSSSAAGVNPSDCPAGFIGHGPIAIGTDADWTSANGVTGGDGSATSPFVISCLSIQVAANGTGIAIASGAANLSYVIRDVELLGAGSGTGIGIQGSSNGAAVVTQLTLSGFGFGLLATGSSKSLQVTRNAVSQATLYGIDLSSVGGSAVVDSNSGTGNSGTCMAVAGTQGTQVINNSCTGGSGLGLSIQGVTASGNVAQNNVGNGFQLGGGAVARNNRALSDAWGITVTNPGTVVDQNVVEGNNAGGIDLSGSTSTRITNNTIQDNGGPGIAMNPANTNGFYGYDNQIVGNHVGGNPYGVVFFGDMFGNSVSATDWTDGAQSIADFGDQNTVVDAGSAKRAAVGQPVLFSDWIARATMGPGGKVSTPNGPQDAIELAAISGIGWNFGDGSGSVSVTDPTQGHGPAPQLSHAYGKAGTYTAVLTVTGTNSNNQPVSLTDTLPVYVAAPAKAAKTAACVGVAQGPGKPSAAPEGWPMLGNGPARTFCNPTAAITPSNVNQLVPKWRFPTVASVTASPAVATVPVGATPTQMVYDGDFNDMFYALNANTGLPVWSDCLVVNPPAPAPVCDPAYPTNAKNQVDYGAIVASPAVATVGTTPRVFEAATDHMWALDAATGKVAWTFDTAGHSGVNNYEIEASPLVVSSPTGEQLVVFSVDCNGFCDKPGGVYAVDAVDGHLVWFFDPVGGANYQPTSTTVTSFAPTDTGPASAGDGGCGGIWTSQTADVKLGLLFTSTADCPQKPMASPYYEAAFALNLATGAPVWHYQPRTLDAEDMDFGATPNVYTIQGAKGPAKDVVGFGSKDGTYSLLDAASGAVQWVDKLTVGGNFGGFYNSATDGSHVYLTSALGTASGTTVSAADDATKGRVWAIDGATGAVNWVQDVGAPTLGQNSVIPGVYFNTGLDHAVHAYSTDTGAPLAILPTGGAVSSGPAIVGDQLFVGAGTGSTWRAAVGEGLNPIGFPVQEAAPVPIPIGEYGQGIWGFCVASDAACVTHGGGSGLPAPPGG